MTITLFGYFQLEKASFSRHHWSLLRGAFKGNKLI